MRQEEGLPGMLDLRRLRDARLHREPYEFVIVEDFLRPEAVPGLIADYPAIRRHGSFPLESLPCGPAVERLAGELASPELRAGIEEKFAIDLSGRPTMITLRGRSDGKDGRIHTDSATKIVTLLVYLNAEWTAEAGRLRLLRGPEDIDDYAAEIPPLAGRMVAFRRSEQSFHGHRNHLGPRRVLQLNWVTDAAVVSREIGRHRWSARVKAFNPFAR